MEEKNNSYLFRFIGDAIIIAIITVLGYFVTYHIEASYIGYFGFHVDLNLVSPSIIEIISFSFTIFLLVICCLLFSKSIYGILTSKIDNKHNILFQGLSVLLAYFVSLIVIEIIIFRKITLSLVVKWIIIFIFIIISAFIGYFLARNRRLKDGEMIFDSLFLSSHFDSLTEGKSKLFGMIFILFSGFLLTFIVTSDIGTSIAEKQVRYNVVNSNPPLVVLTQYQDILVAAPFNIINKQLIPQMHLMNINTIEDRGLFLIPEEIGPLQPFIKYDSIWDKIAKWLESDLDKIF